MKFDLWCNLDEDKAYSTIQVSWPTWQDFQAIHGESCLRGANEVRGGQCWVSGCCDEKRIGTVTGGDSE
jgi:hypothetical protein